MWVSHLSLVMREVASSFPLCNVGIKKLDHYLQCFANALSSIRINRKCVFHSGPVDSRGVLAAEPAFDERHEPEFLPRRGNVLLAPWFSHKGVTNNLWQKFVQRALSLVISTPGQLTLQFCQTSNILQNLKFGKCWSGVLFGTVLKELL